MYKYIAYKRVTVIANAGVQVLLGRVYAGSSRRQPHHPTTSSSYNLVILQPHHPTGHNIVLQRRLQSTLGGLLRRLRRRPPARRANQFQNRSVCICISETLIFSSCYVHEFITKCK